jgi:hypothetical protein
MKRIDQAVSSEKCALLSSVLRPQRGASAATNAQRACGNQSLVIRGDCFAACARNTCTGTICQANRSAGVTCGRRSTRGEKLNLTEDEIAFYDALEVNDSAVQVLGDDMLMNIARELVETVRNNATIDWTAEGNCPCQAAGDGEKDLEKIRLSAR